MRRLLLSAFIAVVPMVLAATASKPTADVPQNPYAGIYEKNIAGLSKPDQTLDAVLAPDAELVASKLSPEPSQSKTCSQRCSTTCSRSCTTTRGCSSNCKRQTDGCGGVSVPAPPPATSTPAANTAAVAASSPTTAPARVVYLADGTAIYHASLQCSAIRGANGLVARPLTAVGDGFEPCTQCGAPSRTVAASAAVGVAGAAGIPLERSDSVFTLASDQTRVRAVQGTPTAIIGESWQYGQSLVYFHNGRVIGYSNASGNLKVSLGARTSPEGYFSVGSTREEVLAIHGTPTAVIGDSWMYDHSMVMFQGGRVKSYSNLSGNLRVK